MGQTCLVLSIIWLVCGWLVCGFVRFVIFYRHKYSEKRYISEFDDLNEGDEDGLYEKFLTLGMFLLLGPFSLLLYAYALWDTRVWFRKKN